MQLEIIREGDKTQKALPGRNKESRDTSVELSVE
jgi:hypothetical protein